MYREKKKKKKGKKRRNNLNLAIDMWQLPGMDL